MFSKMTVEEIANFYSEIKLEEGIMRAGSGAIETCMGNPNSEEELEKVIAWLISLRGYQTEYNKKMDTEGENVGGSSPS